MVLSPNFLLWMCVEGFKLQIRPKHMHVADGPVTVRIGQET